MMQRVAAYCRVSTDKDDQVNSLESQKKYFREYIDRNPYWDLSEVYVDDYAIIGLSGRNLDISRGLELGPIIFLPSFYYFI